MAEQDLENPFSREQFDELEKAIAETMRIEKAINKAKTAGLDVTGMHEQNRANRERLTSIRNAYKRV